MRYTISAATAAAILATISEVEAHCRFVNAYGNYNQNSRSRCLGFRPDIPRSRYGNQIPWQVDVTCFSSPVVPATKDSPYYHTPRKWLSQGCGATLFGIESYYNLGPTNDQNMWDRNTKYYMKPMEAGALTQVKAKTQEQADNGMMVRVTPGGWLKIDIFQVNDDGAGPFRCRIDQAGDGTSFGNYLGGIVYDGANAEKSVYPGRNWETHTLTAPIPKNIKCTAKYGRYNNVCIMRCENIAVNGPFGGCIPFQVVYPTPPPPPQKVVINYDQPEAQPQYGNAGYNVGSGNYIESYGGDYKTSPRTGNKKRDMDAKEERRSSVARSTEGIAKRENEDQDEDNVENDEDENIEKRDKKDVEKRDEENVEKRDHGEHDEEDNEDGDNAEDGEDEDIESEIS
ncbi:hypothetical protein H072_10971 [Dactylellina haptotyla CBS 200.50]|uniref:Uncharacterized protein n=1 Tax=Dactylellina haptotyla (strain CBS 200.50) TaxID=1284197 RepID=S7ZXW0_DACHA|nr:hypothetical protein H072_10971 [Dactylellina haptotyla CBS 200.50]